jgi:molecular chaperone GrpE
MEDAHDEAHKQDAAEQEGHEGASQAYEGNAESPKAEQEAETASLVKDLAEMRDRYVRLMADFENFKKRALKEQSELLKYQGERVIVDLLEVLDNLELALNHSSADAEKLKTGLEMIKKMFVERLGKWDVRGESGVGAAFDPQRHSAISRVPSAEAKPGTIVGELKKAYFYKDKLIRPGEVVVAAEPEGA